METTMKNQIYDVFLSSKLVNEKIGICRSNQVEIIWNYSNSRATMKSNWKSISESNEMICVEISEVAEPWKLLTKKNSTEFPLYRKCFCWF